MPKKKDKESEKQNAEKLAEKAKGETNKLVSKILLDGKIYYANLQKNGSVVYEIINSEGHCRPAGIVVDGDIELMGGDET